LLLSGTVSGTELYRSALNMPYKYADVDRTDDFDEFEEVDVDEKKNEIHRGDKKLSKAKAVALSLLLPGAGQYYAGAKGRAEAFIGAELAIWAGALAFYTYGNWKEDDYIRFAEKYAGIDPSGKNDEFFKNLTFYDNREEYNSAGRIINPSAPYYPNTRAYYWQWDDDERRLEYRNLRNASKTAFRKATFMIGMAVFNRILAGIDSFRAVKKAAEKIESKDEFLSSGDRLKFKFKANPFGRNPAVSVTLSKNL
jgi:hypothetical protein